MAVTHARIKYLQNDFIEFAPIDNIQEFKKVRPKHKMDFSKTKVYNAVYQDEKNPQPVLLHVQIADLACGLSDMESMQRKRPSLARINVSDIPNTSSNKSESENEDAEQQLSQVQITQKKKLMMVQRGKKILSKINNRNTSLKEIVDSDDNSDLENVGNNSQLSLSTGIDHQEKEKETDPLHMTSNIEAQNSNRKSKSGIGAGTINIDLENKIQFFRVELPSSSGCRPSIVPEPNNTQVNNDNPVNLSSFAGCRSIDNPQGNNDSSVSKMFFQVSLPRRSPVRSPSRSPIRSPSRSPSRSPIRSPSRSPIRSPIRSPSRSPSRSPIRSPINSDRSRSPAPLDDAQLENNEFVKKFVSRSIIESIEFYKAKEGYGFEERSKRYKPTEDGMLYLGEGKSIKADIWRMMMVDKPNIFYRKLLTKLWDPRDLANRALQKEKVSKPIHNRSPVKNVESNLLRLSISLFNDFLDKQRIYTPEDKANFLKQTRNILSQKIRDLRAIERQKASGVNAPRKKLRYD